MTKYLYLLLLLFPNAWLSVVYAETKCAQGDYYVNEDKGKDERPESLGIEADHHIFSRLENVYYDINDLSPDRSNNRKTFELDSASKLPNHLSEGELDCLKLIYGRNGGALKKEYLGLANLAIQKGQNKIPDFIIGEYGRFFENDTDIDDDGVVNHFDPNPLEIKDGDSDLENRDHDQDGIPNHLDWDKTKDTGSNPSEVKMAQFQACLFDKKNCKGKFTTMRNYEILLIDNESEFNSKTLEIINDTLFLVFRHCDLDIDFCKNQDSGFESLTKIYASGEPLIQGKKKNLSSRFADIHPGSRTMYFYNKALSEEGHWKKFRRLITTAHEFMHAVQYSFDYPGLQENMQLNYAYKSPKFVNYMRKAEGFKKASIRVVPNNEQITNNNLFLNEVESLGMSHIGLFRNKKFSKVYVEYGNKIYSRFENENPGNDSRIESKIIAEVFEEFNVVHDKQYSDLFEWHAYLYEAYLANIIIDKYLKDKDQIDEGNIVKRRIFNCMRASGEFNAVFYEHISQSVYDQFSKEFPVNETDLQQLADKYLSFTLDEINSKGDWCKLD